MNWPQVEQQLQSRPLPKASDKDAFWEEFGRRTAETPRDVSLPEPIGVWRLAVLAAAAVAILAGVAVFVPTGTTEPIQVASTEVKSVDVVASHAGVIIMTAEAEGADMGGTVLWIADLELGASEGN